MENLEKLKDEAIQEITRAITEQMSKDGIIAGEMHLKKIDYINKDEKGAITLSYPLEKGTYHNYCYITIEPDGKTKIHGTQTSPELRKGVTKTHNGAFDINITIENWKEPESLKKVTEAKYGEYHPTLGLFDEGNIESEVIDCEKMYDGIYDEFQSNFESDEDYQTHGSEGHGLPKVPCVEFFNNGVYATVMTPKHATILLRKAQNVRDYRKIILFANCFGYQDMYDIDVKYVDLYVMDSNAVKEEKTKVRKEYEEYKTTVLESIRKQVIFDYQGIISKELSKDSDFIKRLSEIIINNPNNMLAKKLGYKLGIVIHLTHTIGENQGFKNAAKQIEDDER